MENKEETLSVVLRITPKSLEEFKKRFENQEIDLYNIFVLVLRSFDNAATLGKNEYAVLDITPRAALTQEKPCEHEWSNDIYDKSLQHCVKCSAIYCYVGQ